MRRVGLIPFAVVVTILVSSEIVSSQELEPRAYSASPIGTNFLIVSHSNSAGQIGLDDSLPIRGVTANINADLFIYSRTFNVGGRMGSITTLLPYLQGDVSGIINGEHTIATRAGFADFGVRFVVNIVGNPALTPEQFARRKPTTTVGVSETVFVPIGAYAPSQLINIGTNRWSSLTELGMERPLGRAFADLSMGVRFFADNTDFLDGNTRSQAPLANAQFHAGYNFRPGFWAAVDGTYYAGGATRINGGSPLNELANSRYGATLAYPFGRRITAKLFYSHWLTGRYGSNYAVAGLTFQYRWFDRP